MSHNLLHKGAFAVYDLTWRAALPWLKLNQRLADGFDQRTLNEKSPDQADLWIQAASVGESYLAMEILKVLEVKQLTRILLTANTRQGVETLEKSLPDINLKKPNFRLVVRYFPFDKPSIMATAVDQIQPKVMVLLETEIWPGLLRALKARRCGTIIINGRITAKSLKRYRLWPSIWQPLCPDTIMAISAADAERFGRLFGRQNIDVMPNIKYDRLAPSNESNDLHIQLRSILPPDHPFVVLASVRREEESDVLRIVHEVARDPSQPTIGVFPRHIQRLDFWQDSLTESGLPWALRSTVSDPIPAGTVILWDTFGELMPAYQLARSAFVGGSLAPLGGQNFLEALVCGVIPVIGPSWSNFAWVGVEIIDAGLLRVADNWQGVAKFLLQDMAVPPDRSNVMERMQQFLVKRQGGTDQACRRIEGMLAEAEAD
jgi:3-deoxy-D-manno-octulosonic-acid transferase